MRYWLSITIAMVVGSLLLGVSGQWYRIRAEHYAQYSASVPIPEGTLNQLPMHIGDWSGRDQPLSSRVVEVTDTEDHVNRVYFDTKSGGMVALFVGYGVRFRDLAPHRPEVCYPAAGWVLLNVESVALPTADGQTLDCRMLRFEQSGLGGVKINVLNYYIVNDTYWPDVSEIRHRAAELDTGMRYVAQVQITAAHAVSEPDPASRLIDFARVAAPEIRRLIESAVQQQMGSPGSDPPVAAEGEPAS